MKNANRFQKFFYRSFCIFGTLAVIAFLIVLACRFVAPFMGMAMYVVYGYASLLWMASASLAVFCLIMLTQNRPLHHNAILVNVLSIAGVTLLVLAGIYVAAIYGFALLGYATSTPLWAIVSYWVKIAMLSSAILLHAAFLFSYRPLRFKSSQLLALICSMAASIFAFWDLGDYSTPDIYRPFTLLFGVAAFLLTISAINVSKPIQKSVTK